MSVFQNINVVSYYVKSWEAAKAFYEKVLEWPVAWADDTIGWVEYGPENATHLAINRWDGEGEMPTNGGATAVLGVASVSAVYAALKAKGVRCTEPVSIPGVVIYGTFYDPDGNSIQYVGGE
jgi:predicted enzyme related to lactoylglutathione lyase